MVFNIIVKMPGVGLFFFFLIIYLFVFDCTRTWLLCGLFSSCGELGLLSSCGVRASHCGGFSCCGTWAHASVVGHVGSTAQLLPGIWDLPDPEIELMSPALADGFFTTEPPGKPLAIFLSHWVIIKNICDEV